jgi:hypothetical protein
LSISTHFEGCAIVIAYLLSPLCCFVKLWVLGCKLHVGIVDEHFEILIYDESSNFFDNMAMLMEVLEFH